MLERKDGIRDGSRILEDRQKGQIATDIWHFDTGTFLSYGDLEKTERFDEIALVHCCTHAFNYDEVIGGCYVAPEHI